MKPYPCKILCKDFSGLPNLKTAHTWQAQLIAFHRHLGKDTLPPIVTWVPPESFPSLSSSFQQMLKIRGEEGGGSPVSNFSSMAVVHCV